MERLTCGTARPFAKSAQAAADAVAQVQTEPRGTVRVSPRHPRPKPYWLIDARLPGPASFGSRGNAGDRPGGGARRGEGIDVALRVRPSLEDGASAA